MEFVNKIRRTLLIGALAIPSLLSAQTNVIDEVVWIVGDEAILKSDVENNIKHLKGQRVDGNPYCIIPEQLAIRKLFVHQAKVDSIIPSPTEISGYVEMQLNEAISNYGSKEKLEEYEGTSISQLREMLRNQVTEMLTERDVRKNLTKDIKITPADVRRYFKDIPTDEIPYIPTQVEVQILSVLPEIPQEEIDRVKTELRDYTERINKGESSFSSLARLYSECASSRYGGELQYSGRAEWVPAFAAAAFSLQDTKKVSNVVETEFGFHIIQLVDKLGEKIKVRHILRKPQVDQEAIDNMILRLDSLADDIRKERFSFEAAVSEISDDVDTRNNNGLMVNEREDNTRTSRFYLQELPQDVAKIVSKMNVGEVSTAFVMKNKNGKDACAIVKLKNIIHGHKASISEDFQILKNIALESKQEERIKEWISEKQKTTYVRINDSYRECEFQYPGWVK